MCVVSHHERTPAVTGRSSVVFLLLLSCLAWPMSLPDCAQAECIDCGAFLHWVAHATAPGAAFDLGLSGGYAVPASYDAGVQVVDLSNPSSPQVIGTVDTPGAAERQRASTRLFVSRRPPA